MSQRTSQGSVTEFLECNAEELRPPNVEQYKCTTTVDLSAKVFLGGNAYHRWRWNGISGYPNADWDLKEGTVEDAIEQLLDAYSSCHPPSYRKTEGNSQDTGREAMRVDQSSSKSEGDTIAIPLPTAKPMDVADLDPLILAQGNIQQKAHIPVQGGDEPVPLCVHGIDYKKDVTWILKTQVLYPDPNAWFDLCTKCIQTYEQVTGSEEGQA